MEAVSSRPGGVGRLASGHAGPSVSCAGAKEGLLRPLPPGRLALPLEAGVAEDMCSSFEACVEDPRGSQAAPRRGPGLH